MLMSMLAWAQDNVQTVKLDDKAVANILSVLMYGGGGGIILRMVYSTGLIVQTIVLRGMDILENLSNHGIVITHKIQRVPDGSQDKA